MRKYIIYTRSVQSDGSLTPQAFLEPHVHKNLYSIPAIQNAVAYIKEHEEVEMLGIRLDKRLYGIVVYTGEYPDRDKYSFSLNKE